MELFVVHSKFLFLSSNVLLGAVRERTIIFPKMGLQIHVCVCIFGVCNVITLK